MINSLLINGNFYIFAYMDDLIKLAKRINDLPFNIKAESVIEDLIISGFDPGIIFLEFKTSHNKNWDHDIISCTSTGNDLVFELSRDGLYHTLPEYLFIIKQENSEYDKKTLNELNKKQVKNANTFFHSIDYELFSQRIELEKQENCLRAAMTYNTLDDLSEFWKIDRRLGIKICTKFCKLMPLIYKVVGNFNMTTSCLEFLLDEPVSWTPENRKDPINIAAGEEIKSLGNCDCGESFYIGGNDSMTINTIVFTIGPIECSEIKEFIPGGQKRELLKIFENYFIPVELETDYLFNVTESAKDFFLDHSFLGFDSIIN